MQNSDNKIDLIIKFGKQISRHFDVQMKKNDSKLTQESLEILIKELNSIFNGYRDQITEEVCQLVPIDDEKTNRQPVEKRESIIDIDKIYESKNTLKDQNPNPEQNPNHQRIEQVLHPIQIPEVILSQNENVFQFFKLHEQQHHISLEIIKNQKELISYYQAIGLQVFYQPIFNLLKQFFQHLLLYHEETDVSSIKASEVEYYQAIKQITEIQKNQLIDIEEIIRSIQNVLEALKNYIKDIYQYGQNQQNKLKQIKAKLIENQLVLNNFQEVFSRLANLQLKYTIGDEQLVEKQKSLEQDQLIAYNKIKAFQQIEAWIQNQQEGQYQIEDLKQFKKYFLDEVKKQIFQFLQTTIQSILQEETTKLVQSEKQNFKDYELLKNEFQNLQVLQSSQDLEQLRQLLNFISSNQVVANKTIQYLKVLNIFKEFISDQNFM